jgi:hypothetical protein
MVGRVQNDEDGTPSDDGLRDGSQPSHGVIIPHISKTFNANDRVSDLLL